jgi:4-hydroxythreonine-4-phosphate dehydrogenase
MSKVMTSPILLTMGDPAGIGPECLVRAHASAALQNAVVIADAGVMRRAVAACGLATAVETLRSLDFGADLPDGALRVYEPDGLPDALDRLPWGQIDARCGLAATRCIEEAVRFVQLGLGTAVVTAPLHKGALAAAGVDFPGHTEMLQNLCAPRPGQLPPVRMMLANDQLKVVLVTIHQSLRSAVDAITTDVVLQTIVIAHHAALRWGQTQPRIAVAGLNPHAGEGGLFGDEEIRVIQPAVDAARQRGIQVFGPFAPDTVFMRARHAPSEGQTGEFDLVIAMTHDQGLIPVKYLGVERGVNVTLGLPMIRTSPDHGTAFDIAGSGKADPRSLIAAVEWARAAVQRKQAVF